jgi:hypothetical protein
MYLGGRECSDHGLLLTQQLGNDYLWYSLRYRCLQHLSVAGQLEDERPRQSQKTQSFEPKSPAHQQMRRAEVDPICVIA